MRPLPRWKLDWRLNSRLRKTFSQRFPVRRHHHPDREHHLATNRWEPGAPSPGCGRHLTSRAESFGTSSGRGRVEPPWIHRNQIQQVH